MTELEQFQQYVISKELCLTGTRYLDFILYNTNDLLFYFRYPGELIRVDMGLSRGNNSPYYARVSTVYQSEHNDED